MSSIKIQDGLPDIVAARFQAAKESGDLHAFDSTAAVLELNGIPVTIPLSFLKVILSDLYTLLCPFLYTPSLLPSYYPRSFLYPGTLFPSLARSCLDIPSLLPLPKMPSANLYSPKFQLRYCPTLKSKPKSNGPTNSSSTPFNLSLIHI